MESLFDHLLLFLVSLIANLLSALAGGGAGLLQLPALLFLGLPFSLALATHKVASVFLGLGAGARHFRSAQFNLRFILVILAFGLPGVVVGANVILAIPDAIAEIALGVLTLALGIYSVVQPNLGQIHQLKRQTRSGWLLGGLVLLMIGVLNGSLTSGTGLFVTLWLIVWFGLDYKTAIAYTLVLVGIFWNGIGAFTLGFQGQIQWDWLPALIVGSFFGGYLGAHLSIIKGNRLVKRGFEVITVLVGSSLILKNFI
ncbi:MAG: permease [Piscirickettsiaceae bacterium CG_4_9_14_3_um_filter_43_564]|nr:sulfite exporter TauE/SafE family protein [Thiomicrospira sp.]PIQ03564.1 MAG: permease [Piscirickettsiaceae bacterium CG18_big_fil_WC_8_21_14_2_50_44_103]PIU38084.1 MAG: permease [Piscirickettsiaceae bacterium CG07_land_8_20_14_0_80_44_28]PIW56654.1 MAG: permease [Piscirickettsiaceae bacterium CG12_big_fil_rev_8_21_14_0_65_44_934]PIW77268.1 MAG: permease [Piscirickettsiaceae bacterium CG_4_8_14_3_um_filter_44_38]PIX79434.1 MAG: permease [Piscirickettsiaceae bacterium CG_4_10_14_3_um_filter_